MKTGSAVGKLEPSYTHEDFWKEYRQDVDEGMTQELYEDLAADEETWLDNQVYGGKAPPTNDIDKVSPPATDPPDDDERSKTPETAEMAWTRIQATVRPCRSFD